MSVLSHLCFNTSASVRTTSPTLPHSNVLVSLIHSPSPPPPLRQWTCSITELKRKWEDDIGESPPSKHPNLGPPPPSELNVQPPLFQYKCKCEDNFTNPPSSKCPYLTRSLSQAISSHQSTSPFTELKRKREDDNVESSPSKRPNLGLPSPPEPSSPPTTQYKCKREDNFTNPPLSKCPCLTRSLSQAISSHQLTFPFTELKQKWEDVDVESSPSKCSNLGLPPPPEPSAPPPTTQYKRKHKDDSTGPPSSKHPFLAHLLSRVISSSLTSSIARFLPRKSVASSPPEVSNTENSNPSAHPKNRFEHQYLYCLTNFLTRS